MAWILQASSASQVSLEPEYSYKDSAVKIENRHRTRDGSQYKYRWGKYDKIKFTVRYINSETQSVINTWWDTNVRLEWYEEGSIDVRSVYINNKNKPIDMFIRPYYDKFQGTIELEGY